MTEWIKANNSQYFNLDQFDEIRIQYNDDEKCYDILCFYKEHDPAKGLDHLVLRQFVEWDTAREWLKFELYRR